MRLSESNSCLRRLTAPFLSLFTPVFGPRRTSDLGPGRGRTGKKLARGAIPASGFVWLTLIPLALVLFLAEESAAQGDPDCPDDMLVYLTLDDTSGPPFLDHLGAHDAACGGLACPTYTASGQVSGAQSFVRNDATGIDIPAHSDFDFGANSSFSIEYWMMTPASSTCSGNQVIVGRDDFGSQLHWWTGCKNSSGVLGFIANSTTGAAGTGVAWGSTDVTDGSWHHVVAVHDDPANKLYLYLDGSTTPHAEASINFTGDFASTTAAVNVGFLNYNNSPGFHFDGVIDEVALYARALSPAEIAAHYADSLGGDGYCEAATCVTAADCPPSGEDCREFDCVAGICQLVDLAPGTACTDDGVSCTLDECDGQGVCEHLSDCPVPGEACNRDVNLCESADCPLDLVAYWKFDGSGSSFADFADGHDGVCGDAACPTATASGVVAGAQDFSAVSNTGIDVPADADFDFGANTSFSFEYWVRTPASSTCSGNQVVIGRDDPGSALHWWTGCLDGGAPGFYAVSTANEVGSALGSSDISDGLWHHVVAVHDDSANALYLYLDGNPTPHAMGSIDYTAGFASASAEVNLGWLDLSQGYNFTGALDEVAVYARALSPTEVTAHYTDGVAQIGYCGEPLCPPGMFAYLPLDDTSGPPFLDYLGAHNGACGGSACPSYTASGAVAGAQSFSAAANTGIDVPAHTQFDFGANSSFSVEYWMMTRDASSTCSGTQVVVGRDDSGSSLHWWTGCLNGGTPAFYAISSTGEQGSAQGSSDISDGNWHHIVAVHDDTANLLRLYLDGGPEAISGTIDYTTGDFASASAAVNVGHLNLPGGYNFDGAIDEVAFYHRALSPTEVSQHYLDGMAGDPYCESPGCDTADDCPVSGEDCQEFDCVSGVCELLDLAAGTACTDDAVSCTLDECDGLGVCEHLSDCPVAGEACNRDVDLCEEASCPADLIAFWKLDGSGTTFADFADGHDGVCGDAACPTATASGVVAGAQDFVATANTGIDVPADADFDFGANTSFSFEYWMRTPASSTCSGNQVVIGRDGSASGSSLHWWSGCFDRSGIGTPVFIARSSTGAAGLGWAEGSTDLTDGNWHQIVAVHDDPANTLSVYVDGNQTPEGTASIDFTGSFASASAAVNLGWIGASHGYNFDGTVDEVAVYTRALTPTEIAANYQSGQAQRGYCELAPCSDSVDNDGDGYIDYPADLGCLSADAATEDPGCDLNGDGVKDRDDVDEIFAASNTSAANASDPRDVDQDGMITVLDGRLCTLECDNPNRDPPAGPPPACGLAGPELLVLLVGLGALRRRRRDSMEDVSGEWHSMKGWIVCGVIGLLALAGSTEARALTISVLASPSSATVGEQVEVTVEVSGLGDGEAPSLGAFDLDLTFAPALLAADEDTISAGSFLGVLGTEALAWGSVNGGVGNVQVISLLSPDDLDALQGASFVLGTVSFDALALGSGSFEITRAALSNAFGLPLTVDAFVDATVTIVPEASTALLLAAGLAGLAAARRRRSFH